MMDMDIGTRILLNFRLFVNYFSKAWSSTNKYRFQETHRCVIRVYSFEIRSTRDDRPISRNQWHGVRKIFQQLSTFTLVLRPGPLQRVILLFCPHPFSMKKKKNRHSRSNWSRSNLDISQILAGKKRIVYTLLDIFNAGAVEHLGVHQRSNFLDFRLFKSDSTEHCTRCILVLKNIIMESVLHLKRWSQMIEYDG
jgi:hypothetical protein